MKITERFTKQRLSYRNRFNYTQRRIDFKPGDSVVVQNPVTKEWNQHGTIKANVTEKSCLVKFANGSILRRKRHLVRAT